MINLGIKVEQAVDNAWKALEQKDIELAQRIYDGDDVIDELVKNKRRITMRSYHVLNTILADWHINEIHSIADVVIALDKFGHSVNDLLTVLSPENQMYLRENMAKRYGKKVVTVTKFDELFE
jgi:phosphate uptake regulator